MNSIRKLLAMGTGAGALIVVMAFALAPVTVLAEGSHHWDFWRGFALSAKTTAPTAATLSPECTAALKAIKTAHDQDKSEDAIERASAAAGADPAADVQEDKDERAARAALWVTARTACAPQLATRVAPPAPTAACTAAKAAVKAVWQRKDYAAVRSLWTTLKTACGFSSAEHFSFDRR
jgi:hypothetical protein